MDLDDHITSLESSQVDNDLTSSDNKNKRKSEEADAPSSKKVCSDAINPDSSELKHALCSDLFPSLSDPKMIEESSQDLEDKLAFLTHSTPYLENQSFNISSTSDALDSLQNDNSFGDINVDPFIPSSSEISQAVVTHTPNLETINLFLRNEEEEKLLPGDKGTSCMDTSDSAEVSKAILAETDDKKQESINSVSDIKASSLKYQNKDNLGSMPVNVQPNKYGDNKNNVDNVGSCVIVASSFSNKPLPTEISSKKQINEQEATGSSKISSHEIETSTKEDLETKSERSTNAREVTVEENMKNDKSQGLEMVSLHGVGKSSSLMGDGVIKPIISEKYKNLVTESIITKEVCKSLDSVLDKEDMNPLPENIVTSSDAINKTGINEKAQVSGIEQINLSLIDSQQTEICSVIQMKNQSSLTEENTEPLAFQKDRSKSVECKEKFVPAESEEPSQLSKDPKNIASVISEKFIEQAESVAIANLPVGDSEGEETLSGKKEDFVNLSAERKMLSSSVEHHSELLKDNKPQIQTNISSIHITEVQSENKKAAVEDPNSLTFSKKVLNVTGITLPSSTTEGEKGNGFCTITTDSLSFARQTFDPSEEKIDSDFGPLLRISDNTSLPGAQTEAELDKKSELSSVEMDLTTNCTPTPVEGSIADTPCESGETSPCMSTPADSYQASAAPSPVPKEDPSLVPESSLFDESSMDTKDLMEEEEKECKPPKSSRKKKGKKVPAKYKKTKGKTSPVLVDEETRMSANGTSDLLLDEDSQSSVGTVSKREGRKYRCEGIVPGRIETFTVEKVFEYLWPLEGIGEHYFIQENIAEYLGIISFKRKYPDIRRRPIESQEKEYLKEMGLVSEIACDLGLTAVRSEDILDVMFTDFPTKYEELQRVLRERKEKHLKEKGKVEYQIVNLDKSKMQEYSRKAALSASKWNAAFNRERHEERRYSFDLQSFTLHIPLGAAVKLPTTQTRMGYYPIAVLPGQFTDCCKKYTCHELKGMPLQTVLSGPFTAEELAAEAQGADSDEDNTVPTFESCTDIKDDPETAPVVDPLSAEKQPRCKACSGNRTRNKDGKPEPLIICGTCCSASHPTCIDLTLAMIDKIESYSWQCMDCKTCAQCKDPDDEERMIFCDMCDRGYHIYCVGLRRVPNGRWHCKECAMCYTCGSRNPSGNEHIKNAEWQHEFKKDKNNKQLRYACTLCVPCDKYWKRRQFCSVCMKVYRSIPEDGMVRCTGCPKYVHKDVCSIMDEDERYCNICFKSRNKTALNHSRIIAAAKKKMATGSAIWK